MIATVYSPYTWADSVDEVRKLRGTETILPLSEILQGIQVNYPGSLLDVELEYENNLLIYEIEILGHDHRIQHIKVDARTGKFLIGGRK